MKNENRQSSRQMPMIPIYPYQKHHARKIMKNITKDSWCLRLIRFLSLSPWSRAGFDLGTSAVDLLSCGIIALGLDCAGTPSFVRYIRTCISTCALAAVSALLGMLRCKPWGLHLMLCWRWGMLCSAKPDMRRSREVEMASGR